MNKTVLMLASVLFVFTAAIAEAQGGGGGGRSYRLVVDVSMLLLSIVFGIFALRGARWAYVSFILVGLLYFPVRVGFQLNPRACSFAFDLPLALRSLNNYFHLVQFSFFFVITVVQLQRQTWSALALAGLATIALGASVEAVQAVTGMGFCRLSDLVPDVAAALIGAVIVLLWQRLRPRARSAPVGASLQS